MPLLYVLAGPNGAGKTTLYNIALCDIYIPKSLPFLNVDNAAKELGNYTVENIAKAETIIRNQISTRLSRSRIL